MFYKKWFHSTNRFEKNSQGEGRKLFDGINKKDIFITDVKHCMVCLGHPDNTVSKKRFATEDLRVDVEINDTIINVIKQILKK